MTHSVLSGINIFIHVFGSIIFPYGIYTHYKVYIPEDINPIDSAYGQKFKYLTFLDEIIQAFYFILCLIIDLVRLAPIKGDFINPMISFRDYYFTSLGFPIGAFVAITFWGLFFLDRDLVMPAEFDHYFPQWLNHIVHTLVIVLPIIEMVTEYHSYKDIKVALLILFIFQILYLAWIHVVHSKSNLWVYPILDKLSLVPRYLFLGSSVLFTVGLYFGERYLNNLIWSGQDSKKND